MRLASSSGQGMYATARIAGFALRWVRGPYCRPRIYEASGGSLPDRRA